VPTAPIRLDDQVVIVTGAGHGLGHAYALALADRGAAVVCNDVVADRAEATAAAVVAAGGRAVAETSSVATPEGGAAITDAALDAFGRIDALVNNAGQLRNAAFDEMTVEEFRAVLDTHLVGAFHVTQPAYRHMKANGYGRIVFTSSSAGMFGSPWQANYAAAKAGLVGLCNVVALEGAAHGILANAVMPMALTGIGDGGPPPYPPDVLEDTAASLRPIARYMTVENVAPLVVYLASPACTVSHRVLSVGASHVARVFVGATPGWYAPDPVHHTPEDVAAHLAEIVDLEGYAVPESMNDASRVVGRGLPPSARPPEARSTAR
jgi:NAD(P)-dependent dehydrogenase (short-subunit alcohol dehydrogenase family)